MINLFRFGNFHSFTVIFFMAFSSYSLANEQQTNLCDIFLNQAATNYNLSVQSYGLGQKKLKESKNNEPCKNLEAAFNQFATAFGGFGASISHADLGTRVCKGEDKKTADSYLKTIIKAYRTGATANYLTAGLHYKLCAETEPSVNSLIPAIPEVPELTTASEL